MWMVSHKTISSVSFYFGLYPVGYVAPRRLAHEVEVSYYWQSGIDLLHTIS
jgi:hypothetical protein